MSQLLSLPIETLRSIFSHADQPSQKALRLANRQLAQIGQESLFQTVSVTPLQESSDRLASVLARPDLVQNIRKIYLNTFDISDVDNAEYQGDEEELGETLFTNLKNMPRLQSVALRFHPEIAEDDYEDVPQEQSFRSLVMEHGLAVLADLPNVKELAIQDLQNVNETDATTLANLDKVLSRLQSLRLNVAHVGKGMSGSSDYHRENPQQFFSEFPSLWLKPTLANLKHLTLYSTLYAGFFPKCDFRDLHFPQLKTLALGNHTFCHDSQLDWILSHAETLTELYLDDCAIVWEAAVYNEKSPEEVTFERTLLPRESFKPHPHLPDYKLYYAYSSRWADYFRAFMDGLPHLQHFRYGHSPNWWVDESMPFEEEGEIEIGFGRESYMVYNDGILPSEHTQHIYWEVPVAGTERPKDVNGEVLEPSEEDRVALQELCAKLGQEVTFDD